MQRSRFEIMWVSRACYGWTMATAFVSLCSACLSDVRAQGPGGMPVAPVVVSRVVQRQMNLGETFVGTVMPVRRSTVGSEVEGRVKEFLVNEGDHVAQDHPLARLRTVAVDLEMKAAEAELQLRRAELDELERSAPKEIEQAKARMESAEAQVQFNEKRLDRFRDLYTRKALSDDELEEQVYAAEAARKSFAEARSAWELANSGMWDARINQSKARVAIQQETINKLSDTVQRHTIRAPFDGYVTQENVEVGQWVAKGGPVVEMVELDQVDVETHVLERYEPQLRVGAPARVEIEALQGTILEGEVVLIVPQGDLRSRSFPVKVRMKNLPADDTGDPRGVRIKPGMFARVSLPVGRKEAVTMVPKDALVLGQDRQAVWIVTEDSSNSGPATAVPVPVELGVSYDELIEVHGALQVGQRVVVEGNERIRPGQPLRITEQPSLPAGQPSNSPVASPKSFGSQASGAPPAAESNE